MAAEAALRAALPANGRDVDDAVLTYMADLLTDRTLSRDDLHASLGPLLVDTGAVPEGVCACACAWDGRARADRGLTRPADARRPKRIPRAQRTRRRL